MLEPSAFRKDAWAGLTEDTAHLAAATESSAGFAALAGALAQLLSDFLRGLDETGQPIPGDADFIREALARPDDDGVVFEEPALHAFLALARHHGLPSPLLDWTWDARVAAYFASLDAADGSGETGSMSVWALDTAFARRHSRVEAGHVRIVTPPRATNPNQNAQEGLFTMCSGRAGCYELSWYMDELTRFARDDAGVNPTSGLIQLTVPKSEATEILRLLAQERVDGARVFPGPDGVVKRLKERLLWSSAKARTVTSSHRTGSPHT